MITQVTISQEILITVVTSLVTAILTLFGFLVTIFKKLNEERREAQAETKKINTALQRAILQIEYYKRALDERDRKFEELEASHTALLEKHESCKSQLENRDNPFTD